MAALICGLAESIGIRMAHWVFWTVLIFVDTDLILGMDIYSRWRYTPEHRYNLDFRLILSLFLFLLYKL